MVSKKKSKKTSKKIAKKTPQSQKKDIIEERMEHFGKEVERLGEKFGKRMEQKGQEWDSWFHRTFGVVGPLISSLFGLIIFVFLIWFTAFVNFPIGSTFLANINAFLINNIGLFFGIFLFFSYSSYFSRAYPEGYSPVSPLVTATGITIVFWIAMNAIMLSSFLSGISVFSQSASFIESNLVWIFAFFLVAGYIFYSVRMATRTSKAEEMVAMKRAQPALGAQTRRLYRSGKDKILGGVCGGIAEYLGVDPVLIRLLWVLGTFAWGFGIILYIIAWIIIPRNPNHGWED